MLFRSVSLIAARRTVEGPIIDDMTFMISGRRTYFDLPIAVANLVNPPAPGAPGFNYYFYDLNAKMNYSFSERDRLYISGYFGRDVFDFVNGKQSLDVNIPWGNSTGTIRWNHVFSKKLFVNTTAVYNDYKFNFSALQNNFNINLSSGIRDVSIKQDYDFYFF